jgi:4'-phosphopantetheinyl transferase
MRFGLKQEIQLNTSKDRALEQGEVHVWHVNLERMSEQFSSLWDLLDVSEQHRADRYARTKNKQQFVIVRGALRLILGKYLNRAPKRFFFEATFHGRPFVKDGGNLDFNVSHSEGWAAIALGKTRVGIDVEQLRRVSDVIALSRRFFSTSECQSLLQFPQDQRQAAFFRCWTRKEAYIKACGAGLAMPLRSFKVVLGKTVSQDQGSEISDGKRKRWRFFDLSVPAQYVGALVVEGSVDRVDEHMWDYANFRQ